MLIMTVFSKQRLKDKEELTCDPKQLKKISV